MPKLLDYGTEIRMYSWGLFFVTGGLLAAWYTARTARRRRGWGGGLVVFGLLAGLHPLLSPAWPWRVAYLALLVWQLVRRDRRGPGATGASPRPSRRRPTCPGSLCCWPSCAPCKGTYWIEPITRADRARATAPSCSARGSLWVAVALVAVLWLAARPRGADGLCTAAALLCPFWTVAVGLVASARGAAGLCGPLPGARAGLPVGWAWRRPWPCCPGSAIKPLVLAVLLATAWGDARAFVADQQYQAAETRSTLAVLDTLPQDAKLVSTATRVQEKLAGLCERESYGWQGDAPANCPNRSMITCTI